MLPSQTTKIKSASRIVLKRWAITKLGRLRRRRRRGLEDPRQALGHARPVPHLAGDVVGQEGGDVPQVQVAHEQVVGAVDEGAVLADLAGQPGRLAHAHVEGQGLGVGLAGRADPQAQPQPLPLGRGLSIT